MALFYFAAKEGSSWWRDDNESCTFDKQQEGPGQRSWWRMTSHPFPEWVSPGSQSLHSSSSNSLGCDTQSWPWAGRILRYSSSIWDTVHLALTLVTRPHHGTSYIFNQPLVIQHFWAPIMCQIQYWTQQAWCLTMAIYGIIGEGFSCSTISISTSITHLFLALILTRLPLRSSPTESLEPPLCGPCPRGTYI